MICPSCITMRMPRASPMMSAVATRSCAPSMNARAVPFAPEPADDAHQRCPSATKSAAISMMYQP